MISDNLFKEVFSDDEKDFLESLIYPSKDRNFDVDDAFGIFIGFQIDIDKKDKALPTADFRKKVNEIVDIEVNKRLNYMQKKINELDLQGHNFYIYVLPFTDIDSKRKDIMEAITK
ncbi:MAG: Hachiman antiphage defense system protein HamA [Roseburia inulinivorans]